MELLTMSVGAEARERIVSSEARIIGPRIGLNVDYFGELELEGYIYLGLGYDKNRKLSIFFSKERLPGYYTVSTRDSKFCYACAPKRSLEKVSELSGYYDIKRQYKDSGIIVMNITRIEEEIPKSIL